MGAVSTLIYTAEDVILSFFLMHYKNQVSGIVVDSPFENLKTIVE